MSREAKPSRPFFSRKTADAAAALLQLQRFAHVCSDVIPLTGKIGLDNWPHADYSSEFRAHLLTWLKEGYNVGYRLARHDLVIDIDPRNFLHGDKPLTRLCEAVGHDLKQAPRVLTGGGGIHLYFRKPPDIRVVKELPEEFRGIEYKSIGQLMVAPGSIHPETRRTYRIDPKAPLQPVPEAPRALLELIARPERGGAPRGAAGVLEPEQMALLLSGLAPTDFGRGHYDDWIRLCAASHDATGGYGLAEWLEWCAGDPDYDNAEALEKAERHWESFTAGRATGATLKTLFWYVRKAGRGDLVSRVKMADAWQEFQKDFAARFGGDDGA